jgi:hypothetical protein
VGGIGGFSVRKGNPSKQGLKHHTVTIEAKLALVK